MNIGIAVGAPKDILLARGAKLLLKQQLRVSVNDDWSLSLCPSITKWGEVSVSLKYTLTGQARIFKIL